MNDEQTDAAEWRALAADIPLGYDKAAVAARAVLASDWLAAREAAAEVRGAQAVLAAVAADWPEDGMTRAEAQHFLAARAAAAVTTSSAKSSDLATRVPQDESQRAAGGGT